MQTPIDVYQWSSIGPTLSLLAILVATAGLGALAFVGLSRARKRRRLALEAESSMDPGRALHEGEIVLSGIVEHAPESDVAVRVEVRQEGTESESSGSWSHVWREVYRNVKVAPFYLVLADGTRVRVEAPRDVDVADDLDQKVLIADDKRVLSAELVPGEQLHARGWLERGGDARASEAGYRDVEWGWLLRGDRGGMLLSSHPLGKEMRDRAAFHGWYGRVALVLLAAFQLTLIPFWTRALGSVDTAWVLDRQHRTYTDSDGDDQHEYIIDFAFAKGDRHVVEIDRDDFDRVAVGNYVAIRRGAVDWQLGARPAIAFWHALPALFLTSAVWIMYRIRRRKTQPWFRQERLVHTGSGRLPG